MLKFIRNVLFVIFILEVLVFFLGWRLGNSQHYSFLSWKRKQYDTTLKKKPAIYGSLYGKVYIFDNPVCGKCTSYKIGDKGLAVIQKLYNRTTKRTWWGELDPWLTDALYLHPRLKEFFDERACECVDGLYPTFTILQIIWGLKMKPLKKQRWETVFYSRDA